MSYRAERYLSLAKVQPENYLSEVPVQEFRSLFLEILHNGVHGFCFSAYEEGQQPGDIVSESLVRRRLQILKSCAGWVRSFSCTEGNEYIPKTAREFGMKTLVGAWLGNDPEKNEREIEGLIRLADAGLVDIAAVGNEVLYRKDLPEEELLQFIYRVKEAIPGIPVGYVDAYYEFSQRPAITKACDVILANCYPYWEGCPIEDSLDYLKKMFRQAAQAGNGKKVVITETGWPSHGESLKGAVPSEKNALEYFINTHMWAIDEDIEVFYFSSFDESWKVGAEGEVGAYWGIWDKNEKLKFQDL
ncbi:MAG: glycosyl hydrolase family 17 protein [Saprospiraceae bacterium]|nr:glycosyl hydrolase [Lewinellaceae bacterium]